MNRFVALFSLIVALFASVSQAQQVFSQTRYPQDANGAVVLNGPGAVSWDNPFAAANPPNDYPCNVTVTSEPWISEWLIPFDYPFNIPSSAIIVGVKAEIYARVSPDRSASIYAMLVTGGDVFQPPSGSPERLMAVIQDQPQYAWYSTGGNGDTWDIGVTADQLNGGSALFGVRSFLSESFATLSVDSTRMTVYYTMPCYANCDGSAQTPVLNVADFTCYLNKFSQGDSYANCDGSTQAPVLNIADFSCFLRKFAIGCN